MYMEDLLENNGKKESLIGKSKETLKDRLKCLRKEKGLTQEQFAAKIGIKRNSYANYEIGRNYPIDAVIHSICREFGVYETWLRTGEGDMFRPMTEEEQITKWVKDIFSDEGAQFQRRFILMLQGLEKDRWKGLEQYAGFLLGEGMIRESDKKEVED